MAFVAEVVDQEVQLGETVEEYQQQGYAVNGKYDIRNQ
jgi:hypothetical protein